MQALLFPLPDKVTTNPTIERDWPYHAFFCTFAPLIIEASAIACTTSPSFRWEFLR